MGELQKRIKFVTKNDRLFLISEEEVLEIVGLMTRKMNIWLLREAYKDCENEEVRNLIHEFIDRFEKWLMPTAQEVKVEEKK